MNYFAHKTTIVDNGAQIGKDTRIWHWTHISEGASIGNKCIFGQNVYVGNNVLIGNNVKVQNNVSIYDNVVLEDDVFCGPSMVFTNVINPRSTISRKSEYLNTLVKKGATLGANCTVLCGLTIGQFAFIGAGAMVNKDVPDYALMVGIPAKQVGWMSEFGEQLDLPLSGSARATCMHTDEVYCLELNSVSKEKILAPRIVAKILNKDGK